MWCVPRFVHRFVSTMWCVPRFGFMWCVPRFGFHLLLLLLGVG